jgi:hypothetical protein
MVNTPSDHNPSLSVHTSKGVNISVLLLVVHMIITNDRKYLAFLKNHLNEF